MPCLTFDLLKRRHPMLRFLVNILRLRAQEPTELVPLSVHDAESKVQEVEEESREEALDARSQ